MLERENNNTTAWQYGLAVVVGIIAAFLLFQTWQAAYEVTAYPQTAVAATSSAVTVSASVAATISCSTSTSTTAFGTLTDSAVSTSTPTVSSTMACSNSAAGCTLSVKDTGSGANPGLWNSTASSLIESPDAAFNATATLVAGTEGYGIQAATTSAGSGALLNPAPRYLQTGNTVGGLTTTTQTLASSTATTSGREILVTHRAAIAASTPAGDYTDTITYSCTAN